MTEQNYEEQAAEAKAKAAIQGTKRKSAEDSSRPQTESLEDTFHINIDSDSD